MKWQTIWVSIWWKISDGKRWHVRGKKKKTRQVRDKGSNCYIRQLLLWLVFISESTTSGCLTTRDVFGFLNSYNPKKLETRGEREDGKPSAALLPGRFRSGSSKHFSRQTRAALDLLCSNLLRSVIYIYICVVFLWFFGTIACVLCN